MKVEYRDETWGADSVDHVQVLAAPGLENFTADPRNLSGSGDGASAGALALQPMPFVLSLLVLADDADDMATKLAPIRAAMHPTADRAAEYPLRFTVDGEDPKTVFARCVQQDIPSEFTTADRYLAATCNFAMEANDPTTWGDEVSVSLDPAETVVITGTVDTAAIRWKASIAGAVANPQLSSSLAASAVVRYVGSVASGSHLVLDRRPRSLLTKTCTTAQLATVGTYGVGAEAYGALDGGASASSRPPQWFPLTEGAQTITYATTAGTGVCTFTYRLPVL